jgi:GNAT superfamily N-acetyltransferase
MISKSNEEAAAPVKETTLQDTSRKPSTAGEPFGWIPYHLRAATHADHPAIRLVIERSARQLGAADYRAEQIEGALQGAFGVDTQLIDDGTYFVAESADRIVGCGGWSFRRTLFGGDAHRERDASELDPATEAAKIRAFFVDPEHARRGIGRALLERCEREAGARGFTRFELMGTLPGVRLYQALGYLPGSMVHYPVAPGVSIEFVPMRKG